MALKATHKGTTFSVGDTIKVFQKIKEKDKERLQTFEGIVIGIKGRDVTKTFTLRKIGVQQIGIEKIYPIETPVIDHIEVVKSGLRGSRRSKLYYIRNKSPREIEKLYTRTKRRGNTNEPTKKTKKFKKASKKKTK